MELLRSLTKFERTLWITSLVIVTASFLAVPNKDYLSLCASLIGVTSLIFIAKGRAAGQLMLVVFSVFYGIISFYCQYYGEMITYLGMSAPIAVVTMINWLHHPYRGTRTVEIAELTKKKLAILSVLTVLVTAIFYFILKALGNASLAFSTVSVATSFAAASLTFLRSPYYALGYAANDLVLIVLWTLASVRELSYIPMICCFVMFFANDIYGFLNWKKMQQLQTL